MHLLDNTDLSSLISMNNGVQKDIISRLGKPAADNLEVEEIQLEDEDTYSQWQRKIMKTYPMAQSVGE